MYSKKEFTDLHGEFTAMEGKLLGIKRSEYANEENVLKNFEQVSSFEGRRPEELCMTLLLKHVQSIQRAVESGSWKWVWTDEKGMEGMKQRISDARNYLLLLAAIMDMHNKERKYEIVPKNQDFYKVAMSTLSKDEAANVTDWRPGPSPCSVELYFNDGKTMLIQLKAERS